MKIKQLSRFMKSYGFQLLRSGKHLVWGNDQGQKVTTSSTPSCPYAIDNIERDILRVLKSSQVHVY